VLRIPRKSGAKKSSIRGFFIRGRCAFGRAARREKPQCHSVPLSFSVRPTREYNSSMYRCISSCVLVASVLFGCVTTFLWIRSHFRYDEVKGSVRNTDIVAQSLNGQYRLEAHTNAIEPSRYQWRHARLADNVSDPFDAVTQGRTDSYNPWPDPAPLIGINIADHCRWHFFGFGIDSRVEPASVLLASDSLPQFLRDKDRRIVALVVPYWAMIALLAIVPVLKLFQRCRTFYRRSKGLCSSCGYDLRNK
jgi:hypothetical protein